MLTWDAVYNFFGIKDFIYFISSSQIQDMLFPIKLVFVFFAMFFLAFVIYFMLNSSWLQYKFLEDVTEFFSWKSFGSRQISKQWSKIKNRSEIGTEAENKLAIIEAEDFLNEILADRGYEGVDLKDTLKKAGKLVASIYEDILAAHEVRNSIVYDPDFKLDAELAKKTLDSFKSAIDSVGE